jgi:hypothetical protein
MDREVFRRPKQRPRNPQNALLTRQSASGAAESRFPTPAHPWRHGGSGTAAVGMLGLVKKPNSEPASTTIGQSEITFCEFRTKSFPKFHIPGCADPFHL